jgi:hypothetical protein
MFSPAGSDRIRLLRRLRRLVWLAMWFNVILACWHLYMHRLHELTVVGAMVAWCLFALWWNGRQQTRYFSRYD